MRVLILSVLVTLPLFAAEKPAPQTRIKGCTVVVGFRDLRVFYERAVVVGERELPPDAPPEWWGFYPDRKPVIDRDGQQRAVNIPKNEFLRVGEVRIVRMKLCRCPPMFWGARSDRECGALMHLSLANAERVAKAAAVLIIAYWIVVILACAAQSAL